ncbi:DUF3426 domain-containing protein [Corticibacter populi]|uniref:DUF3426 domain-containing protein n=1 Tax=Corticibacter populi TaxID=1550736 RepID=A0A3M6QMN9_9BURK|nr:DUF3426 domain-containing protein [Corticibacter populi]RMX04316.1 DUF3426 domain-containing protein [Corticibacter populi]RZS33128.1 putative Zn finger-like uncharacterized protein [Corticibacter populi]
MSLVTRCPACGTRFKLAPQQLQASDGWVRCGRCSGIFDATQYLQPSLPPEEMVPAGVPEQERAQQPHGPDSIQTTPAPESVPAMADDGQASAPQPQDQAFSPATNTNGLGPEALTPPPISGALPGTEAPEPEPDSQLPEERLAEKWRNALDATFAPSSAAPSNAPPAPVRPDRAEAWADASESEVAAQRFREEVERWQAIQQEPPAGPPGSAIPATGISYDLRKPGDQEDDEPITPAAPFAPGPNDNGENGTPSAPPLPDPVLDATPAEHIFPPPSGSALTHPTVPEANFGTASAKPRPEQTRTPDETDPQVPAGAAASAEEDVLPERPVVDEETLAAYHAAFSDTQELRFVQQAERQAFWRRPGVRAAQITLLVLLLAALGLQYVFQNRDAIAAINPQLRGHLESACRALRCQIKPWQALDQLAIEGSTFQSEPDGSYTLSWTVRNQSGQWVQTPALALSLRDASEQVVTRRQLLPADIAQAPVQIPPRGSWQARQALRVTVPADEITGYQLQIFYPE